MSTGKKAGEQPYRSSELQHKEKPVGSWTDMVQGEHRESEVWRLHLFLRLRISYLIEDMEISFDSNTPFKE
jgi:hypothetical protein